MARSLYPTPDLMTRRDTSLLLMYSDKIHQEFSELRRALSERRASLVEEKNRLENGEAPIIPGHEEWTVSDAEQAIHRCDLEIADLAEAEENRIDRVIFVLAKREGFQAGLRAAALALRDADPNRDRLYDIVCALADNDIADEVLHKLTRDLPDPYTDCRSFFPLPDNAPAPSSEEGGAAE